MEKEGGKEDALICSIFQFMWFKYFHIGQFQAANMWLLHMKLRINVHNWVWRTPVIWFQHTNGRQIEDKGYIERRSEREGQENLKEMTFKMNPERRLRYQGESTIVERCWEEEEIELKNGQR